MNKKNEIPKDFWTKKRPYITLEEALDDVTPIEWDKQKNEDIVVYSVKEDDSDYLKNK